MLRSAKLNDLPDPQQMRAWLLWKVSSSDPAQSGQAPIRGFAASLLTGIPSTVCS